MAQSAALVRQGVFSGEWNVTATADADNTTTTITHGLGATPNVVGLTPLLAAGTLAGWSAVPGATTVVLTKNATTAGSGAAGAQLLVSLVVHHSIQK